MELSIHTSNPQIAIVKLSEQVFGGVQAVDFMKQVNGFCESGGRCLVVDLGDVILMNSSGLGMLVSGMTALKKYEGRLLLAAVPDKVEELLKITRLNTIFDIYETVDEALASWS